MNFAFDQVACSSCLVLLSEYENLQCPCGTAQYCSGACQVAHWKAKHQRECSAAKDCETIEVCGYCRRTSTSLFVCQCTRVYYCSLSCQRKAWTKGHMHICSSNPQHDGVKRGSENPGLGGVIQRFLVESGTQTGEQADDFALEHSSSRFVRALSLSTASDCVVDDLEPPTAAAAGEQPSLVFASSQNSMMMKRSEGGEVASSEKQASTPTAAAAATNPKDGSSSCSSASLNGEKMSTATPRAGAQQQQLSQEQRQQQAIAQVLSFHGKPSFAAGVNNHPSSTSRAPQQQHIGSMADLTKLVVARKASRAGATSLAAAGAAAGGLATRTQSTLNGQPVAYKKIRETVSVVIYKDIPVKDRHVSVDQRVEEEIIAASRMFEQSRKTGSFTVSESTGPTASAGARSSLATTTSGGGGAVNCQAASGPSKMRRLLRQSFHVFQIGKKASIAPSGGFGGEVTPSSSGSALTPAAATFRK